MTYDAQKLPPKEIDARTLRAIAHPLRMRILTLFWSEGAATATMLAKRLGESTGTLSWHLRHLAEQGLIEEDPDRGTKRERWWRQAWLQLGVAVPTEMAWQGGSRWFRCDVAREHRDGQLMTMDESLRGATSFTRRVWS